MKIVMGRLTCIVITTNLCLCGILDKTKNFCKSSSLAQKTTFSRMQIAIENADRQVSIK